MAYLRAGGSVAFRNDTKKTTVSVGLIKVKVSGTNLVPIIDALAHYEAVLNFGAEERERALCSVISKCKKWIALKGGKAASATDPTATVLVRFHIITALLQEAVTALDASNSEARRAFDTYQMRKGGAQPAAAQPLSAGYVNERTAYIASGKKRSVAGSLIDDLLGTPKQWIRTEDAQLSGKASKKFKSKFGGRDFTSLTVKEWQAIEKIAAELDGRRLQTRYMTRRDRLNYMLESDGNGGLRYLMGGRSAASPGDSAWPYAMDEWGNIYTADERSDASKAGYAMFNHSSFTAGDLIVCAGMLSINANGKLVFIDTNSGHYKPTRQQLTAVVTVLRDEYHVDISATEISTAGEVRVIWKASPLDQQRFFNGQPPMPPLPALPGQ